MSLQTFRGSSGKQNLKLRGFNNVAIIRSQSLSQSQPWSLPHSPKQSQFLGSSIIGARSIEGAPRSPIKSRLRFSRRPRPPNSPIRELLKLSMSQKCSNTKIKIYCIQGQGNPCLLPFSIKRLKSSKIRQMKMNLRY